MPLSFPAVLLFAGCALQQAYDCVTHSDQFHFDPYHNFQSPFNALESALDERPPMCNATDLIFRLKPTPTAVSKHIEPASQTSNSFVQHQCFDNLLEGEEHHCIYFNPSFSGGRGMTIFTRPSVLENEISKLSIFQGENLVTQADRDAVPFIVTPIPGKGNGAIASRPILRAEPIISDHAVTVVNMEPTSYSRSDLDSICRSTVDLLQPKTRTLFNKLHAIGDTKDAWIRSAIDRNAFEVNYGENDRVLHFAVVPEPAVINHACRPNAAFYFDSLALRVNVVAVRDISAGEEITIAYRDMKVTKNERREALEHYGFECTCSHCSASAKESNASDERIQQIEMITEQLMDFGEQSEGKLDLADQLIEIYREERFHDRMAEPLTLATMTYNSFGHTDSAKTFAMQAREAGVLVAGPSWLELPGIEEMIHHPEAHWTYNAREGASGRLNR